MARRASLVKSVKVQETNVIALDAGNIFCDNAEEKSQRQTKVLIEGMSIIGYDALNLGEDELCLERQFIDALQRDARFPFLSANLVDHYSLEPVYTSYVIREAGLLQVGIIGLTAIAPWSGDEDGLQAREPVVVLNTLLPQVKRQADFIVVLAHLPYSEAIELLHQVQGINVMIVASSDESVPSLREINDTLVVSAGQRGTSVGKLRIVADITGQIIHYQRKIIPLDEQVGQDSGMLDLINQAEQP